MKNKQTCSQCGSEKYYCKDLCKSCYRKQLIPKKWSKKYNCCVSCKSSKFPHKGKGLCSHCYDSQPTNNLCACGCGNKTTRIGNKTKSYLKGHWMKNNEEFKQAHIKALTGKGNPCYGKFGKDHPAYGHETSDEVREQRRQRRINALSQKSKSPTDIERILITFLDELNIKHISQHEMHNKFVVDEYLPEYNLVIEALGSFWHGDTRKYKELSELQLSNQKRDMSKAKYLTSCGHRVLFLWGKDIKEDKAYCIKQIKLAIENSSIPFIQNPIQ